MTITYWNGQTIKAALVVRTDNRMRVAIEGADDVTEFNEINGTWVSEDCEPARIEFGFGARAAHEYQEEDFVCSKDLAAHLIHRLLNPEEDDDFAPVPSVKALNSTVSQLVM
ncbi:MAG TPA: hypothetical protein VLY24_29530 [Bryobacteraceae bacterium]|nr:hypothetical protein [Bryobacteraceae bacterium]